MNTPIMLILTTLCAIISSCTKDNKESGDTTNATTSSTSLPVETDYRIKFQGNYACKGVDTFYSYLDTTDEPIITNVEFVLTVMRQDGVDSGMTFTSTNYSSGSKVLTDGTIIGEGNCNGRIVSPDSIYFNFYHTSHPGRTVLISKGKK